MYTTANPIQNQSMKICWALVSGFCFAFRYLLSIGYWDYIREHAENIKINSQYFTLAWLPRMSPNPSYLNASHISPETFSNIFPSRFSSSLKTRIPNGTATKYIINITHRKQRRLKQRYLSKGINPDKGLTCSHTL